MLDLAEFLMMIIQKRLLLFLKKLEFKFWEFTNLRILLKQLRMLREFLLVEVIHLNWYTSYTKKIFGKFFQRF